MAGLSYLHDITFGAITYALLGIVLWALSSR